MKNIEKKKIVENLKILKKHKIISKAIDLRQPFENLKLIFSSVPEQKKKEYLNYPDKQTMNGTKKKLKQIKKSKRKYIKENNGLAKFDNKMKREYGLVNVKIQSYETVQNKKKIKKLETLLEHENTSYRKMFTTGIAFQETVGTPTFYYTKLPRKLVKFWRTKQENTDTGETIKYGLLKGKEIISIFKKKLPFISDEMFEQYNKLSNVSLKFLDFNENFYTENLDAIEITDFIK